MFFVCFWVVLLCSIFLPENPKNLKKPKHFLKTYVFRSPA